MWGSSRRDSGYAADREGPNGVWSMATGTAVILASGGLVYFTAQLVKEYGWQGAINYIWEGDPYPHHVRQALDDLSAMDKTLRREESNTLNRLEEALKRAKLDSSTTIDSTDAATILAAWEHHVIVGMMGRSITSTRQTLQTILATLSYNLDRWAAKIDGINLHQTTTTTTGAVVHDGAANLKQQKKSMSNRIVRMMERTDALLTFWKEATK